MMSQAVEYALCVFLIGTGSGFCVAGILGGAAELIKAWKS